MATASALFFFGLSATFYGQIYGVSCRGVYWSVLE